MNKFKKRTIRWLSGYLIFFISSCEYKSPYKNYYPNREDSLNNLAVIKNAYYQLARVSNLVKNGDIITRKGADFTSECLRSLNQRDRSFSHCGIASIENDSIFIYHALGGDFNPNQKLIRESFYHFADPSSNNAIGIYSFDIDMPYKKYVVDRAKTLFNSEIKFDMDFNLQDDERMYCAEFVYKCFRNPNYGNMKFHISHIQHFEFIGVDDIFLHPKCRVKEIIRYK